MIHSKKNMHSSKTSTVTWIHLTRSTNLIISKKCSTISR